MDTPLNFQAKLFVERRWTGTEQPPMDFLTIAAGGIARRANEISRHRKLTECADLRRDLNIELLRWEPIPGTPVEAWAHCISLDADPDLVADVEARENAMRRHVIALWQHEEFEREERLLRPLLTDPLRATAWWFTQNQDKPAELETIAATFQRVRTLLQPEKEEASDSIGSMLDEYIADADQGERLLLARRLTQVFHEGGYPDLATRLQEFSAHEENQ